MLSGFGQTIVSLLLSSPGMTPVSGDFNGDGCSDLTVYDIADGRWYARTVSGNVIMWGMLWLGQGTTPIP